MKDFEKYFLSKKISSNKLKSYAEYINPLILEERSLNVVPLDVFSRLLMDRILFIGCPIDDEVSNIIQAQLLYLDSTGESPIQMYINSPGGVVSAGLAIYDTMNLINSHVITTCTGLAASMASILLCAGKHGDRQILPHAKVMIHQPMSATAGQASDILIEAKEIEKCRKELYDILVENTGQSYEKIFTDADRDYWMTAEEAVNYGIVDKIIK